MGLRSEAEEVRLALEAKGRTYRVHEIAQVEVKLDGDKKDADRSDERWMSQVLIGGIYRLARWCTPSAGAIKTSIESGNIVAPQLVPNGHYWGQRSCGKARWHVRPR